MQDITAKRLNLRLGRTKSRSRGGFQTCPYQLLTLVHLNVAAGGAIAGKFVQRRESRHFVALG